MAAPVGLDREQVVDTAVSLLAGRDRLDDLALREIAEELGVRTQSLYAHVDGVDGLHRALALRSWEALADRLNAAAIGRAGGDAVAAVMHAYLDFAVEEPGLYDASLRPPGDDPELLEALDAVTRPLRLVFASYGLDEDDAGHWFRTIYASVHGFALLRRDGLMTMAPDPDRSFDLLVDVCVRRLEEERAA